MSTTMLNVYDLNRKKTAVLQNAFSITETQELNKIYSLSFSIPAADEKVKFIQPFHYVRWGDDHNTFKANIEALESAKAEAADVYSKSEADALLADKSGTSHTHDNRYYTESEIDTKLSAKANLASPALTGTPTAPTAASGTNTTQIATTAFVKAGLDGKAASSHTHDDRYYTESEMDTKLGGKAASSHTHAAGDIASGTLSTARGGTGNANGTIAKLTTARSLYTALGTAYNSSSPVTFDGSADKALPVSGTLPIANGGTGNANGTVAKLTTARTIRTNLASTSTASFDGSANIAPGVTGTLPIANGGTGNTTGNAASATKLAQNRRIITYLANKYDNTSESSNYNGQWDLSGNTNIPVYGVLGIANGGNGYGDSTEKTISNSSVFSGSIKYRRIGNFIFIYNISNISLQAALSSGSVVLCTLPSAFQVGGRITRGIYALGSSEISGIATFNGNNGNVALYASGNSITTSNGIYLNIIAEL